MNEPLAIDLFCGLGGWSDGLIAEGWRVIGYDIEAHEYGEQKYPGELIIQDVLTLHGRECKDASLIVASPPCQEYSYMAMPWSRGKAIEKEYLEGKRDRNKLTALFDACFRIQREASEAAGRYIPLVVENVRGAQKWVGKARWNFGSYYLWGDVPALMPIPSHRRQKSAISCAPRNFSERIAATPEEAHRLHYRLLKVESLFADSTCQMCGKWCEKSQWVSTDYNGGKELWCYCPDCDIETFHPPKQEDIRSIRDSSGFKSQGMNWSDQTKKGQDFTRIAGQHCGQKTEGRANKRNGHSHTRHLTNQAESDGVKQHKSGRAWFADPDSISGSTSSKSSARKAASAMIAKIPFPLAQWIAKTMKPQPLADLLRKEKV